MPCHVFDQLMSIILSCLQSKYAAQRCCWPSCQWKHDILADGGGHPNENSTQAATSILLQKERRLRLMAVAAESACTRVKSVGLGDIETCKGMRHTNMIQFQHIPATLHRKVWQYCPNSPERSAKRRPWTHHRALGILPTKHPPVCLQKVRMLTKCHDEEHHCPLKFTKASLQINNGHGTRYRSTPDKAMLLYMHIY